MLKRRWRLICLVVAVIVVAAGWFAFGGTGKRIVYPPSVWNTERLRGVMSPTRDMTEDDLKVLAGWNANLVRFQIMRNWLKVGTDRDLAEYDSWFNSRLDNLEAMLPVAKRLGIRFVLDFHTPPGGWRDGRIMCMFDEEVYADHFVAVWRRIAERFINNPNRDAIWAYDLVNEPIESPEAKERGAANALFLRAARAIREVDPQAVLVVSCLGGGGTGGFYKMQPLPLDNVIYQAHMYMPFSYTHQFLLPETTPADGELIEYPGFIDGEMWTKSRLRKDLQHIRDFQIRYAARIYIGEFSVIAWAPGGDAWLDDCISLFEEFGWDWSYHSFREWEGFSIEHEGTPPNTFRLAPGNPRMKVLLNAFRAKAE